MIISRYYPSLLVLLCSSTLLISACTPISHTLSLPTQEELKEQTNTHTFTALGYAPVATQNGKTLEEKILNAIKASKLDAYKEMAEQVYGVLLSSETQLSGVHIQSYRVKSQVKGLVRGARVLKSYHKGKLYITELVLDMQGSPYSNMSSGKTPQYEKPIYY
ncbi:LPP20 family lipoprotein [Psychromonas sp. CD1]|uniref:LPP20 family lipoprotein n=1 Tax=Psychromonas sp. CD1 TaxID=1979839 RepID=UPI000B9B51D3|nr:LPP20 family lipoprotein [Psychromonas sp. CD1]